MSAIQQEPTPDLNPETLGALQALMLAQAQEIFVQKAIRDHLKDPVIAKLSAQCEDMYAECLKLLQRENMKHLWDKDWIPIVSLIFQYQIIILLTDNICIIYCIFINRQHIK